MEYLGHWQFWLAVIVVSFVSALVIRFVVARIGG